MTGTKTSEVSRSGAGGQGWPDNQKDCRAMPEGL